jgi:hypothetical protein
VQRGELAGRRDFENIATYILVARSGSVEIAILGLNQWSGRVDAV